MSTGRYRQKRRRKSRSVFTSVLLASLVLVLVCGLLFFVYDITHKIDYRDRDDFEVLTSVPEVNSDEYVESGEEEDPPSDRSYGTGDIRWEQGVQNILFIGCDSTDDGYGRSDSTLLMSIDENRGRLNMVSFLRDTYLKIPGQGDNRLNYAYAVGGSGLLVKTLEQNFRVRIDHYVKVDFTSFIQIIDMLDGVDLELTQEEAEELNSQYTSRTFSEGWNHMSGLNALDYARIRKIDSDFGRTQRQRNVIEALIAKFKDSGIPKMVQVVNQVLPLIQTDMDNGAIIQMAMKGATILNYPTAQKSIPAADTYEDDTIRNMMVLVPDVEANKEILWDFLYGESE